VADCEMQAMCSIGIAYFREDVVGQSGTSGYYVPPIGETVLAAPSRRSPHKHKTQKAEKMSLTGTAFGA
jgi:hypothetical protein